MVKCFDKVTLLCGIFPLCLNAWIFTTDWLIQVCLWLSPPLHITPQYSMYVKKESGISPHFHSVERYISSPSVNQGHLGVKDGRANIKPWSSIVLCLKVHNNALSCFKKCRHVWSYQVQYSLLLCSNSAILWERQLKIQLSGIISNDPEIQLKARTAFIKTADDKCNSTRT